MSKDTQTPIKVKLGDLYQMPREQVRQLTKQVQEKAQEKAQKGSGR